MVKIEALLAERVLALESGWPLGFPCVHISHFFFVFFFLCLILKFGLDVDR